MGFNKPGYIMARLKEPSTWTAVNVLVGAVGYKLDVEWMVAAATSAVIIINVVWKRDSQAQ